MPKVMAVGIVSTPSSFKNGMKFAVARSDEDLEHDGILTVGRSVHDNEPGIDHNSLAFIRKG